ncbi:hypothetical protein I317_03869 [Kwoniella heveanensis CBS 569]|nr:hypothetical protein I317_03869 [Kwoniella heveanensis CBS 569]
MANPVKHDQEEGSSARKIRRRAGPFKRSRTGCGTCKRRGKKCDEEWTDEGFCQRCLIGQFECTGRTSHSAEGSTAPSTGPPQSSSYRRSGSQASNGGGHDLNPTDVGHSSYHSIRRPSSSERTSISGDHGYIPSLPSASPSTSTEHGSSNIPHISPIHHSAPPLPPPSMSHSHSQPAPPTHSQTTPAYSAPPLHTAYTDPSISPVWSTTGNSIAAAPVGGSANGTASHDAISFLSTFAAPQPLYDWPGSFATHPSAFLTTGTDGTLAIDSFTWNTGSANNMWNDFAKSFGAMDQSEANDGSASSHQLNSNSRVLFLNSEKPMRQGVSLAEIYARVVESWLVGIPSTTRDWARARILALNDNNSVMRNVRFAVSAAYIFLFACTERATAPDSRPKLVELACKGAGLVDGEQGSSADKGDEARDIAKQMAAEENVKTKQKMRIYVDHVSTPFAADLESAKWTEDAIRELREVMVTDRSQLSDLLWGVIDLQLVEFIRGGAAPSYNMLALGDRLVRSAMGEHHPPITLSSLRTSDTLSLRFYALSDISRCIVQRGRRTIFNFWSDVGLDDSSAASPEGDDDEPWATYLGLPDAIVILLAEIVNLCAEIQTTSTTSKSIKDQADELENALKSWSSQSFSTTQSLDPTALVSRTIAGELWRLTALVLLYQSVHRVGSLHPVLRQAQKQILSLLDSVTKLPSGDLWGFIALPAFLAACLSIEDHDRKRSMQHVMRPGPERVWLDNMTLVEKVWEEVDETGRLPDWHDKMIREGLSIAFF